MPAKPLSFRASVTLSAPIGSGGTGEPGLVDRTGKLIVHPRYRAWLKRHGLTRIEDFFQLNGEIVSGHPERNVAQVTVTDGECQRVVYLKREHKVSWRVRWKNRRQGFGKVSKCEREAITLDRLERAGLPGPQWLAYGEDRSGRAFLLVDGLERNLDLPDYLREIQPNEADRRLLAERIAVRLAEIHEAGFSTPELAAKHIFVNQVSLAVTLIDWQSTPVPGPVGWADRCRQLANLFATLPGEATHGREPAYFLRAYRQAVVAHRRPDRDSVPTFCELAKSVRSQAGGRLGKSSVRDQQCQPVRPQRLVWLADEAACVIPELADAWPRPADGEPFYLSRREKLPPQEWIELANGQHGRLLRFRERCRLGRFCADLRGKSWRSQAAKLSRILFHLERHRIVAPRLLGFGQKLFPRGRADSFVFFQPPTDAVPVKTWLRETPSQRLATLRRVGSLLRALHTADCQLADTLESSWFVSCSDRVGLATPLAVRLCKKLPASAGPRELLRLADLLDLASDGADFQALVAGYDGQMSVSAFPFSGGPSR